MTILTGEGKQKSQQNTATSSRQNDQSQPALPNGTRISSGEVIRRVSSAPISASDVLYLQRTIGNAAVARVLFPHTSTRTQDLVQRDPDPPQGTSSKYTPGDSTTNSQTQYKGEDTQGNGGTVYKNQPPVYKNNDMISGVAPGTSGPTNNKSTGPSRIGKLVGGLANFAMHIVTNVPRPTFKNSKQKSPTKNVVYGAGSAIGTGKHKSLRTMDQYYKGEDVNSLEDLVDGLFSTTPQQVFKVYPPDQIKQELKKHGWSDQDADTFLKNKKSQVTYLKNNTQREQYKLQLGGTITQGTQNVPWDTSNMFAYDAGKGHAIYVMDDNGTFYADQHKVGLFHHSSFLAGGHVAAAGTMQVLGGKLKELTNKSGHYTTTTTELRQAVEELKDHNISPSSFAVRVRNTIGWTDAGTGQDFLDQQSGNKNQ